MVGDSRGATPPVQRLIDEFNRLPGIGPKSAQRLTYHSVSYTHLTLPTKA